MPYGSNFPSLSFRTTGAWGPGNGLGTSGRLTNTQADENIDELGRAVEEMRDNPPTAVGISNVTSTASSFTIHLADATIYGPFPLPVARLAWQGVWTAATAYLTNDLVVVDGEGVYLVLQDHTSAGSFDAEAADSDGEIYAHQFGIVTGTPYDFSLVLDTTPAAGAIIDRLPIARAITIPAAFAGSVAGGGTNPDDFSDFTGYVISIKDDGVEIGTITISAAGTVTWATTGGTAKSVAAGSVITAVAPDDGSDQDASVADWVFVIKSGVA